MAPNTIRTLWVTLLTAFSLSALFFIAVPGIDIAVSSIFFRNVDGFWLENVAFLSTYRTAFNILSISLAVSAPILWVASYRHGPVFKVPNRVWAFITLLYVVGPGLLVNGVFKSAIGRARPADVIDFGGEDTFTKAFDLTGQCQGNCSFVSGEGASATAFFISVLVLSNTLANKSPRYLLIALGFVSSSIAATLRVMKGRHFISDAVLAVLFMALLAVLLSWLLLRREKSAGRGRTSQISR